MGEATSCHLGSAVVQSLGNPERDQPLQPIHPRIADMDTLDTLDYLYIKAGVPDMTASKRESVTVDRDAIARAFVSRGDEVDQETLARVADAMAATAKAVFAAQGVDLRIERKQKASGRSGSGLVCRGSKADASRDGAVVMAGQGLPAPVSSEEGIVRLRKRAVKMPIEKWAGEVLGPMKTAEALGVRRSTLDNWRTRGEIIALPKGKAAHVIPMAQVGS